MLAYFFLIIILVVGVVVAILKFLEGDLDSAVGLVIAGFSLIGFVVLYQKIIKPFNEHISRDKLIEWVLKNEQSLSYSRIIYESSEVDLDTELVRYGIVYSFVYITRMSVTNYCVKGSLRSYLVGWSSTIFSFLLGWWGFPGGLIETPKTIYKNIFKKDSTTVAEVVNEHKSVEKFSVEN